MKNHILILIFFLNAVLLSKPYDANGSNVAAGEINYEWVSDSTYRFYFRLYNSCGTSEPSSVPLCFHDPCNNSLSFSVTLTKTTSAGDTMPVGCTPLKNQCQDASATIPGYAKWTYSGLVTLPARCNSWHIFTHLNYRNDSKNIYNGSSTPLYVETRFNNTGSYQGNSSAYFSLPAVYYFYRNENIGINNGAIDPDGDSLVTELITPLTGVSSCSDTVPSAVSYNTMSPAISLSGNPFQTNNSFTLDSKTGYFSFKTVQQGKQTAAFRVKEYRKGVLIGSQTREIQLYVAEDTVTKPTFAITSTSGNLVGCIGQTINFTFDAKSADKDAIIIVSDNSFFATPGAIISYTHQYSDSVHGSVSWTPGPNDTGNIKLIVVMKDSTCHPPGLPFYYPTYIPMYISPLATALSDTTICLGDTAHLSVINTFNSALYSWSALPGSSTPGNISCPTCQATAVNPLATTTYQVAISNNAPCPATLDTVLVEVLTNLSYPTIQIAANPDTNVAAGISVTFTATKNSCAHPAYQWKVNGIAMPADTTAIFIPSSINDMDVVTCELICNDTCPRPRDTISNVLTMHVSTGIKGADTSHVGIYPNPNNGSFTVNAKVYTDNCKIEVMNALGQMLLTKTVVIHNNLLHEQLTLDLPPGVYQLKVNSEVRRFVVQDK